MAGYKYDWTCPNCGTYLQLKMRVTQTRRKCPQCGFVVTPEEIDRQKWYGAIASLIIVGAIWLCCAAPSGTGPALLQGVIGILVLAVIAFVVYVGYKVYEGRKIDAKKNDFLRSADFQLVSDFAKSELRFESGANDKLRTLLQGKGWHFTPDDVNSFVTEQASSQFREEQSEFIANQIRSKSPIDREGYLKAYIEASKPHEDDYLHVIGKFLNISENEHEKLKDELRSLGEKVELDEFERRLRGKTSR